MARKSPSVLELTTKAGIDTDEAILILLDAGLEISSARERVPPGDVKKVCKLLGLFPKPSPRESSEVAHLALRAGRREAEVRDALVRARILEKRCLKRVPAWRLRKAEELLGLREPPRRTERALLGPEHAASVAVEPETKKHKVKPTWPTIGPIQDLNFLTSGDVLDMHLVLVEDFARSKDPIVPPGLRDRALLESAVHRPRTALGLSDKYPTVAMAAAALLHSIIHDHPFHNGNKRTGLVSVLVFLDKNGWVFTSDQDETYDFLLQLAAHKLSDRNLKPVVGADPEVVHAASWLQTRIRKVSLHELPLQFRRLRVILESFGCVLHCPKGGGNRINIRKGRLQTQVAYQDDGTDVERNTIHKIRKDLDLDEAHGYDSDIFYNRGPRIPEFINKYRKLLDRLAKV